MVRLAKKNIKKGGSVLNKKRPSWSIKANIGKKNHLISKEDLVSPTKTISVLLKTSPNKKHVDHNKNEAIFLAKEPYALHIKKGWCSPQKTLVSPAKDYLKKWKKMKREKQ
jgi:hypothetical protein